MRLVDDPVVLTLWWIAVALTALVIVPLAVVLLQRTWRAARQIRRFTAETLSAGAGIAEHTRHIPALDATVELAGPVAESAGRLKEASGELADVLVHRAS